MPIAVLPPVPHWTPIKPTGEQLEWAELEVIDLAKAKTQAGRAEQVEKARNAMHKQGFFYVINHGLDEAQVERVFDIAAVPFEQVSSEEKKRYHEADRTTGAFLGYKPLQYWHISNGVQACIEHYNSKSHRARRRSPFRNVWRHRDPSQSTATWKENHTLKPYIIPEIQEFVRHNHIDVLYEVQWYVPLYLSWRSPS
ncbi:hypothetical protein BC827DRAFT_374324 [Russula dissimulans]|nr:hypothetical protein BC827DRAFT_374324 [Russula dissimulans]